MAIAPLSESDLCRALDEIGRHPTVDRADVDAYFRAIEASLMPDANLSTLAIEGNAKDIAKEIPAADRTGRRGIKMTHRPDAGRMAG
jgi:hypothetical protein